MPHLECVAETVCIRLRKTRSLWRVDRFTRIAGMKITGIRELSFLWLASRCEVPKTLCGVRRYYERGESL